MHQSKAEMKLLCLILHCLALVQLLWYLCYCRGKQVLWGKGKAQPDLELMSPVTSHVFWAGCNRDSKKPAHHNFLLLLSCLKFKIFFHLSSWSHISISELVGWWDLFILQPVLQWICLQLTRWPALLWAVFIDNNKWQSCHYNNLINWPGFKISHFHLLQNVTGFLV